MGIEKPKKYLTRNELETFLTEMLTANLDDDATWWQQRDKFIALMQEDQNTLFWMLLWKLRRGEYMITKNVKKPLRRIV